MNYQIMNLKSKLYPMVLTFNKRNTDSTRYIPSFNQHLRVIAF